MKRLLITVLVSCFIAISFAGYFYANLHRIAPTKDQLTKVVDFLNTDTTTYDVIFIGSSRIYVHIDPRIIDSVCGVNSYNLGLDGSSITEQLPVLKKYMQKHRAPKLIVLGLDYGTLNAANLPFDYPVYYNYMSDTCFGPVLKKAIPHFKYGSLLAPYDRFIEYSAKSDYQKFAALAVSFKMSPQKFEHISDEPRWLSVTTYKGYLPIEHGWSTNADKELEQKERIIYNAQGIAFLGNFLSFAQKYAPQVITVFTPMYNAGGEQTSDELEYCKHLLEVKNEYHVPFIDYRTDSINYNKKYFYNFSHLNKQGAEVFSQMLANDIKKYLHQ